MSKQDKTSTGVFALSRGGMRTISSFAMAPVIAHRRLRQIFESQDRDIQEDQPLPPDDQPSPKGRFWLSRWRRAA